MSKHGSLLSDLLIGLSIISLFMPFLYEALFKSSELDFNYHATQDEISSLQLRRILALSYDLNVTRSALYFEYENRMCQLSFKNNSLQLSPGTQIFYDDLVDCEFRVEDDVIFIILRRKEKESSYVLASQKGIDFASFSDCDDADFEFEQALSESSEESE